MAKKPTTFAVRKMNQKGYYNPFSMFDYMVSGAVQNSTGRIINRKSVTFTAMSHFDNNKNHLFAEFLESLGIKATRYNTVKTLHKEVRKTFSRGFTQAGQFSFPDPVTGNTIYFYVRKTGANNEARYSPQPTWPMFGE